MILSTRTKQAKKSYFRFCSSKCNEIEKQNDARHLTIDRRKRYEFVRVDKNIMLHFRPKETRDLRKRLLKDGAYFCYCAYFLRISRYSGFLWLVPINTGIFLRGLKQCGESRN